MIRRLLLSITIIFSVFFAAEAQDLLGFGTGNYTGVTGMTLNPASIVDSRLKFDLNLIGISTYYTNNYLSVKRSALVDGSFFRSKYKDWSLVQRDLLEENRLSPGDKVYLRVNNRVIAPVSFMLTTGNKSAIALTITNRTSAVVDNLNQNFARLAYSSFNNASFYGTPMDMSGINMDVLNWLDVGFTYGRVLMDNDKHFLKAAFTGKYIGGVASGYFNSNDLSLSFTDKNTVNATTTYGYYGHGEKLSLDMFKSATLKSLRPEAEGFGWNAGIVYEYRGRIERFKYLTPEYEEKTRRDVNKYAFRIGVSIMDAGRLKFKKSELNNDFSAAITNWNLRNYTIRSINDIDTMLSQRVNYIAGAAREYTVSLPTAYSVQLDLHLWKGFYVNAMTYQPANLLNSDRRMKVEPAYAVTPRFESRVFGIYIPVTYTKVDEWNLGASIRLGPLYFGSANLGSLVFNDRVKSADIHAGLRIPIAFGSPSKVARLFDKVAQPAAPVSIERVSPKADAVLVKKIPAKVTIDSTLIKKEEEVAALKLKLAELERQRLIDSVRLSYETQKPDRGLPVRITINNYSGNGASTVRVDTISDQRGRAPERRDSTIRQQRLIRVDTVKLSQTDTVALHKQREAYNTYINDLNNEKERQIDTLIRRLAQKDLQLRELERSRQRLNSDTLNINKAAVAPVMSAPAPVVKDSGQIRVEEDPEKEAPKKEGGVLRNLFRKKSKPDTSAALPEKRDTIIVKEAARMQPLAYSNSGRAPIPDNDSSYRALQNEIAELKRAINSYGNENNANTISQPNNNSNNSQLEDEVARLRRELQIYNTQPRINAYSPPASEKVIYMQPAGDYASRSLQTNLALGHNNSAPVIIRDTVYLKDTVFASQPARVDTVTVRDTLTVRQEINKTQIVDKTASSLLNMQLEKILFKINQVSVQPSYHKTLQFVAENLKKYPELGVRIDGYTDKTGSPAINERLSMQRANSVKAYLLSLKVKAQQLLVNNHGANEPVAENTTITGQALNRRVELSFFKL